MEITTCEQYVLLLLQQAQDNLRSLEQESLRRLQALEAELNQAKIDSLLLNLLKDCVFIDPSTGRLETSAVISPGPTRDALCKALRSPSHDAHPEAPAKAIPQKPAKDPSAPPAKKSIPQKPRRQQEAQEEPSAQPSPVLPGISVEEI